MSTPYCPEILHYFSSKFILIFTRSLFVSLLPLKPLIITHFQLMISTHVPLRNRDNQTETLNSPSQHLLKYWRNICVRLPIKAKPLYLCFGSHLLWMSQGLCFRCQPHLPSAQSASSTLLNYSISNSNRMPSYLSSLKTLPSYHVLLQLPSYSLFPFKLVSCSV